jgi:hypothetical protein
MLLLIPILIPTLANSQKSVPRVGANVGIGALKHGPAELNRSIPLAPAKAGVQGQGKKDLDSRVRGNERNML